MRFTDVLLFGPPVFLSVAAIVVARILGRPPKVIAPKAGTPASGIAYHDPVAGD
jgi:hypothetical protein